MFAKTHTNERIVVRRVLQVPHPRHFAFGTDDLLLLPIYPKMRLVVSAFAYLPALRPTRRAEQFDLVLFFALHEQVGIYIARIHQMTSRQQVLVCQSLLNICGTTHVLRCGNRGMHLRDQVRQIRVTRLADMD